MKEVSILKVSLINLAVTGEAINQTSNSFEIINNKINEELVDSFIKEYEVTTERVFGKINTILKYKLANGFSGVESTSCVDEVNYSKETGENILLTRLKEKIWFGLGFTLAIAQGRVD